MHNRLSLYLQTNNILDVEQFGLRKGISIENATFKLTYILLKSINKKMHVGGMFCGLAKAFDCVNHKILLTKLYFFGIQGATSSWFRSYLTERKQKIEVKSSNVAKSAYSNWETIKRGVPRGQF
jgi:hypothetical protein